jgi:hypothetical protein
MYQTDIERIYNDFLLIKKMKSDFKIKKNILTHLLSSHSNPWRVVGITEDALKQFKNYDFKKTSRMGIERAHLTDRSELYANLLNSTFVSIEDWWSFYYENDKTVLTTSTENRKKNHSIYFEIDEKYNLFKSAQIGWCHNKEEVNFLRNLYEKHIK